MRSRNIKGPAKAGRFCCAPRECAGIMKVLSETPRLLIVRTLVPGPSHVAAISGATGLSAARVSHHLARMRLAGVVEGAREGRKVLYRINPRILLPNGLDLGCCRILFRPL